jgi:hypothetical protein
MADAVEAAPHHRTQRHASAKLRLRRDDQWIAVSALLAAMLALPAAQNSWHGPEVASVLAVSATAMLASQRWAIALVVLAQVMLVPTLVPRAFFSFDTDLVVPLTGFMALAAIVPGLLATRRAAAALVLVTGWQRTQQTCRRFHSGMVAIGILIGMLPFL